MNLQGHRNDAGESRPSSAIGVYGFLQIRSHTYIKEGLVAY